jgi:putative lipoic acid-binding regulatory protein
MSEELNESPLHFPCEFSVKIFGAATEQFEAAVLDIFHQHVPDLHESAIRKRPSKDGKYLAFTITINAQSKAELDEIYQDLTSCPHVLMAL